MSGNTVQQVVPYRTWIPPEGTDERCWGCWEVFKSGERGVLKHPIPANSANSQEEKGLIERAASVARERLAHGVHSKCGIPWFEVQITTREDVRCPCCNQKIDISNFFSTTERRLKIVKKVAKDAIKGAISGGLQTAAMVSMHAFSFGVTDILHLEGKVRELVIHILAKAAMIRLGPVYVEILIEKMGSFVTIAAMAGSFVAMMTKSGIMGGAVAGAAITAILGMNEGAVLRHINEINERLQTNERLQIAVRWIRGD